MEGKREGKEGKGKTPKCFKCVDANVYCMDIVFSVRKQIPLKYIHVTI